MKAPALVMTFVLLVAGATAVPVTAVPLSGLAQSGDVAGAGADVLQTAESADNETAETPPGARLAGVVGAQQAEVRAEVDSRAFGVALERAASEEARARIVARQTGQLEERLADLEERKEELQRAHASGNITTTTYEAELTELAARSESARGLTNQSRAAARGLPRDVAESQGINVTAIGMLEERAANMTGPEVARIARSIAGPDVGRPVSAGPPDHARAANGSSVGPPDHAGPANDSSAGPPDPANDSSAGPPGPANDSSAGPPGHAGQENVTDGGPPTATGAVNDSGAGVGPPASDSVDAPGNAGNATADVLDPVGETLNVTDDTTPDNE